MPENSNVAQYTFTADGFGPDDLLVASIDGEEAVSSLFRYRVVLADREGRMRDAPKLDQLLAKPALLKIMRNPEHGGGEEIGRYVSGIISKFRIIGRNGGRRGGSAGNFATYEAEIVPLVWLLNFRVRSRIFQKASVREIVQQVLEGAGVPSADFYFALQKDYPQREYCVQYRESEWNFIARLLEEEGIFFYFKHTQEGHVLVMGDAKEAHLPISGDPTIQFHEVASEAYAEEHVHRFHLGHQIGFGSVALRDFEFSKPVPPVDAKLPGSLLPQLEFYDYPAQYVSEDKKLQTVTQSLGKVRMEEFQAPAIQGEGEGIVHRFVAGSTFKLSRYPREAANQTYLLTHARIRGFQPQVYQEFMIESPERKEAQNYSVEFLCIPYSVPFRPPRVTPKPVVRGSQTAIVVGPSGEEIYTDEHGRVKVHFHWDRENPYNEKASCWIRVSHYFAGGKYGAIFTPRIGQEVIVDFLEGNPDEPIITGRVYNGDHRAPYDLPGEKTKSTLRTNSSKGGGGANELRFEDKKGKEQVFLHAERDLHIRAKNDRVVNIENDSHETVDGSHEELVKKDRFRKVDGSETILVKGSRGLTVKGGLTREVKGAETVKIGMDYKVQIGKKTIFESSDELTLKGPSGYIKIAKDGIYIYGTTVHINGKPSPTPPIVFKAPAEPPRPDDADKETPGRDNPYN